MQVDFSKTTKLQNYFQSPLQQVQFVVFTKIFVFNYYTKLHEKSFFYLSIMYMTKLIKTEINLYLCYNFALELHENALVFSQSDAKKQSSKESWQ